MWKEEAETTGRPYTLCVERGCCGRGAHLIPQPISQPHHLKLEHKLGEYCPDLPIHILQCHYAALLSPFEPEQRRPWDLDRVSSSVLAVTCLRAQDGLERQVESHVFGLKKASSACEGPEKWLTTDDGCMWLLDTIDEMSDLLVPSP